MSGTITDNSANPLSGATVILQLSSDLDQVYGGTTAADGTYSIAGLPPSTYDVTVFADGYLATTQTGVVVATNATVNATLTPSGTTLDGNLVDSSGNPVPSGSVVITDTAGHILATTDVNPDGSFTVTSAQGENLLLHFSAQGYAPETVSISAATGETMQLSPVVLRAVAIDPNISSTLDGEPPSPVPPDGQLWADQQAQWRWGTKSPLRPPHRRRPARLVCLYLINSCSQTSRR